MAQLTDYGKPLKIYRGTGILRMANDDKLHCGFELAQMSDGNLYALCQIDAADALIGLDAKAILLEGSTEDGRMLTFADVTIARDCSVYKDGTASRQIVLYGRNAKVRKGAPLPKGVRFLFSLTNLTMLGTESFVLNSPDGSTFAALQIPLTLNSFEIALRRVADYEDRVRSLKATRGVDVTCEASVIAESAQQDAVLQAIGDLCLLLTLARGCRVEWIFYEVTSSDGEVLKSYHRGNAITKPFGVLELVGPQPPEDTIDFVNKTFPNLDAWGKPGQFREAVDLYTDAKSEQDFFELRGLKMVIIMEHLKGCYLRRHGMTHILKPKTFEKAKDSLVSVVRWTLPALFPDAPKSQLDMMANHAQGFNWYPFRRAIKRMCESLGLSISSKEHGRFVNIRNELVHRVEYNPRYGDSWTQYCFLMTFVGKVLLAILGHDGHYYDWTKYAGAGVKSDMRVELDLDSGEVA